MRKLFGVLFLFAAVILFAANFFTILPAAKAESGNLYLQDFVGSLELETMGGQQISYPCSTPTTVNLGAGDPIRYLTYYKSPTVQTQFEISIDSGTYQALGIGVRITLATQTKVKTATVRPVAVNYSVRYFGYDNALLYTETVAGGGTAPEKVAPAVENRDFIGWRLLGSEVNYNFSSTVNSNIDLYAIYTLRPVYYTVSFYDCDNSLILSKQTAEGSAVAAPDNPAREGYDFTGWRLQGSEVNYDFSSAIQSNIDLYACYNLQTVYYTVTFYDGDDNNVTGTVQIEEGAAVAEPDSPMREGYDFIGWRLQGSEENYDFSAAVHSDVDLFAVYAIRYLTVCFYDETTLLQTYYTPYGSLIIPPEAQEKTGKTFEGWKKNGATYDFDIPVKESADFYAAYNDIYFTVTFQLHNGSEDIVVSVKYGEDAAEPSIPEKADYLFTGWDADFSRVKNNLTIHAVYVLQYVYFTLKIDDSFYTSLRAEIGKPLAAPELPARTGYTAKGWQKEGQLDFYDFSNTVSTGAVLNAVYERLYFDVVFLLDGGAVDNASFLEQRVEYGNAAENPGIPQKEGHTFTGWDTEFDSITSHLTINALYTVNQYSIKYYRDGVLYMSFALPYMSIVNSPREPSVQEGYYFDGWYDGDIKYIFGSALKSNLTLSAVFKRIELIVTFISQEEELYAETVYYGDYVIPESPAAPTGYLFDAWYENESLTVAFDAGRPIRESKTVYAAYTRIVYDIIEDVSEELGFTLISTERYYGSEITFTYNLPAGYKITEFSVVDEDNNAVVLNGNSFIMPPKNVTITLQMSESVYLLTVRAEGNGDISVGYGDNPMLIDPQREDMIFTGWYIDEALTAAFTGVVMGEENDVIILYAAFIKAYYNATVIFPIFSYQIGNDHLTYTAENASLRFYYNTEVTTADFTASEMEGHTFSGWYLDSEFSIPFTNKAATEDFCIYAKYLPNIYKAHFYFGENNSLHQVIETPFLSLPEEPEELDCEYGRFDGWNHGIAPIEGDAIYYATYLPLYNNRYYDGDTLIVETKDVLSKTPSSPFNAPIKEGHSFTGFEWYNTEGKTMNYRAVFSANRYTVVLNSDRGGTLELTGEPYYGSLVTVKAKILSGYEMLQFSYQGIIDAIESSLIISFVMPANDVSFSLTTKKIEIAGPVSEKEINVVNDCGALLGNVDGVCGENGGDITLNLTNGGTGDSLLLNSLRLKNNERISFSQTVKLELYLTEGGAVSSVSFREGGALKMMIPLSSAENVKFAVISSWNGNTTYHDYYIDELDGKQYIVFQADRTGDYTIVGMEENSSNAWSVREIAFLSAAVAALCIAAVSVISMLKKKKRLRY